MKKNFKSPLLPAIVLLFALSSCSSSSGIDDYFTFNLSSAHGVSLENGLFQNQPVIVPIAISIDSTSLATNGTDMFLVKSLKLNLLRLVSEEPSFPFTNIDSLIFSVQADSIGLEVLATYNGASDSLYYSNADFVQYWKAKNSTYRLTMYSSKPPSVPFSFTVSTTAVLTARPLQ